MSREIYQQMIEAFGQDPQINRIIPAEDFNLPDIRQLRLSKLVSPKQSLDSVEEKLESLYEDVQLPYVVDNFSQDIDRDNWRMKLDLQLWNLINENALRVSAFTNAKNTINSLEYFSNVGNSSLWDLTFHYLAGEVCAMVWDGRPKSTAVLDRYRSMSKDDQVRYARAFKQKIANFLDHLGRPDDEANERNLMPLLGEKALIHPDMAEHVLGSLTALRNN